MADVSYNLGIALNFQSDFLKQLNQVHASFTDINKITSELNTNIGRNATASAKMEAHSKEMLSYFGKWKDFDTEHILAIRDMKKLSDDQKTDLKMMVSLDEDRLKIINDYLAGRTDVLDSSDQEIVKYKETIELLKEKADAHEGIFESIEKFNAALNVSHTQEAKINDFLMKRAKENAKILKSMSDQATSASGLVGAFRQMDGTFAGVLRSGVALVKVLHGISSQMFEFRSLTYDWMDGLDGANKLVRNSFDNVSNLRMSMGATAEEANDIVKNLGAQGPVIANSNEELVQLGKSMQMFNLTTGVSNVTSAKLLANLRAAGASVDQSVEVLNEMASTMSVAGASTEEISANMEVIANISQRIRFIWGDLAADKMANAATQMAQYAIYAKQAGVNVDALAQTINSIVGDPTTLLKWGGNIEDIEGKISSMFGHLIDGSGQVTNVHELNAMARAYGVNAEQIQSVLLAQRARNNMSAEERASLEKSRELTEAYENAVANLHRQFVELVNIFEGWVMPGLSFLAEKLGWAIGLFVKWAKFVSDLAGSFRSTLSIIGASVIALGLVFTVFSKVVRTAISDVASGAIDKLTKVAPKAAEVVSQSVKHMAESVAEGVGGVFKAIADAFDHFKNIKPSVILNAALAMAVIAGSIIAIGFAISLLPPAVDILAKGGALVAFMIGIGLVAALMGKFSPIILIGALAMGALAAVVLVLAVAMYIGAKAFGVFVSYAAQMIQILIEFAPSALLAATGMYALAGAVMAMAAIVPFLPLAAAGIVGVGISLWLLSRSLGRFKDIDVRGITELIGTLRYLGGSLLEIADAVGAGAASALSDVISALKDMSDISAEDADGLTIAAASLQNIVSSIDGAGLGSVSEDMSRFTISLNSMFNELLYVSKNFGLIGFAVPIIFRAIGRALNGMTFALKMFPTSQFNSIATSMTNFVKAMGVDASENIRANFKALSDSINRMKISGAAVEQLEAIGVASSGLKDVMISADASELSKFKEELEKKVQSSVNKENERIEALTEALDKLGRLIVDTSKEEVRVYHRDNEDSANILSDIRDSLIYPTNNQNGRISSWGA